MRYRGVVKAVVVVSLLCGAAFGQAQFPMKYLGEVGHLEERQVLDLGVAQARLDDDLVVEGKQWHVRIARMGGMGWTTVWSADFDANGKMDLLIAGHFPGVGRCIDTLEVSVVLFREDGIPEVWKVWTTLPDHTRFPYVPIVVRDLNGDGRAEFVTTSCERVDPPEGFGERYSLTGVFEARNAELVANTGAKIEAYTRIVKRVLGLRELRMSAPSNWQEVKRRAVSLKEKGR